MTKQKFIMPLEGGFVDRPLEIEGFTMVAYGKEVTIPMDKLKSLITQLGLDAYDKEVTLPIDKVKSLTTQNDIEIRIKNNLNGGVL